MAVKFTLNGQLHEVTSVAPSTTVLDFLRERVGLKGTKEGCAEGDCGACTIVVSGGGGARQKPAAVNSCLMLVPQLDGSAILTVEGVARANGLHPVQAGLVAEHATQCGFCTPGFVMALIAYQHCGEPRDEASAHEALAGNLCRCTGYRPIVDAALGLPDPAPSDPGPAGQAPGPGLGDGPYEFGGERFHAPVDLAQLLELRAARPQARILGGGTDLGLLASMQRRSLGEVIWTRQVKELRHVRSGNGQLAIGSAATYSEALPAIDLRLPRLGALIRRIGSRQIRNLGTIGGNACTASPVGDTPPVLLALDAVLIARSVRGTRRIRAADFFTGYRRNALAADEILAEIRLPLPGPDTLFGAYKIGKRHDQDIAAVIGAFAVKIEAGTVTAARIAFGGMAATPATASACETRLLGNPWSEETVDSAAAALAEDFAPISDLRAGAAYRLRVAQNLLRRLYAESARTGLPLDVMVL